MATMLELARQKEELDRHTPELIRQADAFVELMKEKKQKGIKGRDGKIIMKKNEVNKAIPKSTQFTGLVRANVNC